MITALSLTTLVVAVGGGIDLSRAVMARQQLSEVAILACQYASRPSVTRTVAPSYTGANGSATYRTNVTNFITTSLTSQKFPWIQTNATPFTFIPNGPGSVTLSANVPTAFMKIINVAALPVGATSNCYDSTTTINQTVPDGNSPYIVFEGFESGCGGGWCAITANGTYGAPSSPSSAFPSSPSYIGSAGTAWYTTGYCLEVDQVGVIKSSVPQGSFSAELDCDDGSGGAAAAGNSAISTKAYMAAGSYELRYNYVSRVDYPDYDPAYICGSTAADLSWANDTNAYGGLKSNVLRTNQINVYLDVDTAGSPPRHTTIDGTQQLAGSNLIDMCVYAPNWVERSVRIRITTPGFYWLSFAGDGANDSLGGQIDNIRLCTGTCPGAPQDNFPPAWAAAYNGGVDKVLFEDTFESPTVSPDFGNWISKSGNLNLSTGTSGTTGSGWPNLAASGWATAPFNQVDYILQGAEQGSRYVALDGNIANGGLGNRSISRSFLLDPGYYQVSYSYISNVDFSASGAVTSACAAAPGSGNVFGFPWPASTGNIRFDTSINTNRSTNLVGAFMASGQLISTPIGGGALASATRYANTDGTVSTTPNLAPDAVDWLNYDATAANPVIDACAYAPGYAWVPRSVSVKITKPGYYWLTFSANGGTADGNGGGIDDVKLTALGGLSMSGAPTTSLTTIPVPAPQPDSTYTDNGAFSGFEIVADPRTPPAASP